MAPAVGEKRVEDGERKKQGALSGHNEAAVRAGGRAACFDGAALTCTNQESQGHSGLRLVLCDQQSAGGGSRDWKWCTRKGSLTKTIPVSDLCAICERSVSDL